MLSFRVVNLKGLLILWVQLRWDATQLEIWLQIVLELLRALNDSIKIELGFDLSVLAVLRTDGIRARSCGSPPSIRGADCV